MKHALAKSHFMMKHMPTSDNLVHGRGSLNSALGGEVVGGLLGGGLEPPCGPEIKFYIMKKMKKKDVYALGKTCI